MIKAARSVVVLGGLALLGACAPVAIAGGPAGSLSVTRGSGVQFAHCSGFGQFSSEAARMGVRTAAVEVGGMRRMVHQIQSRVMAGFSPNDSEAWKRGATGDC